MRENRLGKEITIILIVFMILMQLILMFSKPKAISSQISFCTQKYGENWQECVENFDEEWENRWEN